MNARGQSLVLVLLGTAVAAATLLALSQMLTSTTKYQRNLDGHVDFSQISDALSRILDSPALCQTAFWDDEAAGPQIAYFNPDLAPSADKLPSTVKLRTTPLFTVGKTWDNLQITRLQLAEIDPTVRRVCPTSTIYLTNLIVAAQTARAFNSGQRSLGFPFYVAANNTNHQITGCGRRPPACL